MAVSLSLFFSPLSDFLVNFHVQNLQFYLFNLALYTQNCLPKDFSVEFSVSPIFGMIF